MSEPLPPLDPQLAELLDAERTSRRLAEPELADVRTRVMRKVAATIGSGGPGGDAPPDQGPAPSGGGGTVLGAKAGAVSMSKSMLALVIGASVAAGAGGASLYWSAQPHRVQTDPVFYEQPEVIEPSAPSTTVEPTVEPTISRDPPTAAESRAVQPATPRSSPRRRASIEPEPPPEPSADPSSADRERTLIDRARAAMRIRQPHQALLALMEHERLYPDGRFAPERDRLVIEALRAAGRHPQAKRRVEQFLERYPDSPHAETLRGGGE